MVFHLGRFWGKTLPAALGLHHSECVASLQMRCFTPNALLYSGLPPPQGKSPCQIVTRGRAALRGVRAPHSRLGGAGLAGPAAARMARSLSACSLLQPLRRVGRGVRLPLPQAPFLPRPSWSEARRPVTPTGGMRGSSPPRRSAARSISQRAAGCWAEKSVRRSLCCAKRGPSPRAVQARWAGCHRAPTPRRLQAPAGRARARRAGRRIGTGARRTRA